MTSESNRRKFLGTAAGAAAFTLVPRHALGGPNYVPPSDKINLAYIGVGTQGLREMLPLGHCHKNRKLLERHRKSFSYTE